MNGLERHAKSILRAIGAMTGLMRTVIAEGISTDDLI
jgi:hypothetical protein